VTSILTQSLIVAIRNPFSLTVDLYITGETESGKNLVEKIENNRKEERVLRTKIELVGVMKRCNGCEGENRKNGKWGRE
jgi:hypothetical protein